MKPGTVVWITGLPSSGKSSLAEALRAMLLERGRACCVLDGDAVRTTLVPRPGYTPPERTDFYASLAGLAGLLAAQGLVVIVPATANRTAFRERARAVAPRFLEVWVDTPLSECKKRDTKGLYAAGASREIDCVPGLDERYEAPTAPDVIARGGVDPRAIDEILQRV